MNIKKLFSGRTDQIEVTRHDINLATAADSSHCMIADAIARQLPGASRVSVDLQSIRFSDKVAGERYIYLTPPVCQSRLLVFDQGLPVEPFNFRLPHRPDMTIKIRASANPNKGGRPKNAGPRTIVNKERVKKGEPVSTFGGEAPPLGALAHSGSGRVKGTARKYGLKAAGQTKETMGTLPSDGAESK